MENTDIKFRKTLEDIRLHFDFLFKRGFRIVSVLFAGQNNENWQVTLMASNRLVDIYSEQGLINLALGVIQQYNEAKFFDLQYLAQFVDSGRDFFHKPDILSINETQQLKKIAGFLEKHIVTILAQVEKENLPTLNRPLNKSITQQKRTII
jgi:hypothetical protein